MKINIPRKIRNKIWRKNYEEWRKRATANQIINQIQLKIHYLHRIKNLRFLVCR